MNEGTVTKEQLENYRKHAERCPDTDYVYAFTAQQMNEVSAEAHRRGALEALDELEKWLEKLWLPTRYETELRNDCKAKLRELRKAKGVL